MALRKALSYAESGLQLVKLLNSGGMGQAIVLDAVLWKLEHSSVPFALAVACRDSGMRCTDCQKIVCR
jgi:hypothetical protein